MRPLSILRTDTGISARSLMEVEPLPKSSMAILIPFSWISLPQLTIFSYSSKKAVSVISTSNKLLSTSYLLRSLSSLLAKSFSLTWRCEKLTDIGTARSPSSLMVLQASSATNQSRKVIAFVFSSSGINSEGILILPSASFQRTSASALTKIPVLALYCG